MQAIEVGKKLVAYCNANEPEKAVAELYADSIVSIEPDEENGGIIEGMQALLVKHEHWNSAVEVHETIARGPYIGRRENEFAVKFDLDATPQGSERQNLEELAYYTVEDGKVVREEFMFLSQ
ncbi:MAG: SnoaL-like domain-containing protein [Pseudomonadota bacterium]